MKPEYLKAIENIDADRKRWMKAELMVDLQITGEMAETLIDEYFVKRDPAPTFWIAKSRLARILSKEIDWPHVYTTDQSEHFECVPLFISAETPAPAPHLRGRFWFGTQPELLDQPALWMDDPAGGDPIIIATFKRIYKPELLSQLAAEGRP